MRAFSAGTKIPDAYRAGAYLGEQLKPLMPEVVFLFTTIDYGDSEEILEGLHDGLEHDCIVIGSSGDCTEKSSTRQSFLHDFGLPCRCLISGNRVGARNSCPCYWWFCGR